MSPAEAKRYLLSKPEAIVDFPFGPEVAVLKVQGKMFATLGANAGNNTDDNKENSETNMNLKCDPDEAVMLRDIFDAVVPGYHMNKRHWNTIIFDGSIPKGEIERMIDNSYALVVKGLPRSKRVALETAYGKPALYN
ncbi:MAG: MmcQ/YjbR family DNA-binding protein [Halioglobus sp.]